MQKEKKNVCRHFHESNTIIIHHNIQITYKKRIGLHKNIYFPFPLQMNGNSSLKWVFHIYVNMYIFYVQKFGLIMHVLTYTIYTLNG